MTIMLLAVAWLLTYLVHSTLLLGAAWFAGWARLVRGPAARDVMWKVALVGGVVTASLQLVLPARTAWNAGRISFGAEAEAPVVDVIGTLPAAALATPRRAQSAPRSPVHAAAWLPAPAADAAAPRERLLGSVHVGWPGMLLNIWMFGALGCLVGLAWTGRQLRRSLAERRDLMGGPAALALAALARECGLARPVRLTVSDSIPTPMLVGTSEICLPARALERLSAEELRAVLAHELGHLLRRDPAWRLAGALVVALLFFQPLNRIARRRLHETAEFLCDEWAAARSGGGLVLARCLAEVAAWMRGEQHAGLAAATAMASKPSQLVTRVQRLLDGEPSGSRRAGVAVAAVGVLSLGLVAWSAPGFAMRGRAYADAPRTDRVLNPEDAGQWMPAAVARGDSDAWLEVREDGHKLVLSPAYSVRMTGSGHIGLRQWGRMIELADDESIVVDGHEVDGDAVICANQNVRIVGGDGQVRWRLEPIRLSHAEEMAAREISGEEPDEARNRSIERAVRRGLEAADAEADDTVDIAADIDLANDVADQVREQVAPAVAALGASVGSDVASQVAQVADRATRDWAPRLAAMGTRLGRDVAQAVLADSAWSDMGAGLSRGDARVRAKRKPKSY